MSAPAPAAALVPTTTTAAAAPAPLTDAILTTLCTVNEQVLTSLPSSRGGEKAVRNARLSRLSRAGRRSEEDEEVDEDRELPPLSRPPGVAFGSAMCML